jgi:uncharacterized RDD family membrane protein YckC
MDSPSIPPPPPADASTATPSGVGERAEAWRRLVAIAINFLILAAIGAVISAIFGRKGGPSQALGLAVGIAWVTYFDGGSSPSPGKRLMGIRVADPTTGGDIGYGRSAIRYVGVWLSCLPCFLGGLWMLWDANKQTWTDKLSSSVVVKS